MGKITPRARAGHWFVYLLECGDGTIYTGITTDVNRRVNAHAAGRGARYTRSRSPVRLLTAWGPLDEGEARRQERGVKRLSHQQKRELARTGEGGEKWRSTLS